MATCAEDAALFVAGFKEKKDHSADLFALAFEFATRFQQCSDFPQPKPKKVVWQWRFRYGHATGFGVSDMLMDREEADAFFQKKQQTGVKIKWEIHAGPFEIEL